ncbi:MAG TPA: hypothetical protein VGO57_17985 [Verrucomicrobiae bacterium]|jgi:hypothetical protein
MSQPQIDPNLFGQNSQTMFYTEGQKTAVLVTRKGKSFEKTHPRFTTANLALMWCRKKRAGFIYMPAVPGN